MLMKISWVCDILMSQSLVVIWDCASLTFPCRSTCASLITVDNNKYPSNSYKTLVEVGEKDILVNYVLAVYNSNHTPFIWRSIREVAARHPTVLQTTRGGAPDLDHSVKVNYYTSHCNGTKQCGPTNLTCVLHSQCLCLFSLK